MRNIRIGKRKKVGGFQFDDVHAVYIYGIYGQTEASERVLGSRCSYIRSTVQQGCAVNTTQ